MSVSLCFAACLLAHIHLWSVHVRECVQGWVQVTIFTYVRLYIFPAFLPLFILPSLSPSASSILWVYAYAIATAAITCSHYTITTALAVARLSPTTHYRHYCCACAMHVPPPLLTFPT